MAFYLNISKEGELFVTLRNTIKSQKDMNLATGIQKRKSQSYNLKMPNFSLGRKLKTKKEL